MQRIGRDGHEGVFMAADDETGLRAIVAIHSTTLGPALGGTRFRRYPGVGEALEDVLNLSRAMTFKAAAAGLSLGGGKAVIIGEPSSDKTESLLEEYGRVIETLGGRYLTAEDVGTTVGDMRVVRRVTRHVTGFPEEDGGSGDPSPATARGVVAAMRAVAERLWDTPELAGRRVAVQGVGKVGSGVVTLLAAEGCDLVVADINEEAAGRIASGTGAAIISPGDILRQRCDILSPCAIGPVLTSATIPDLCCRAVVGSANNQLGEDADADRLAAAGILYAPDFVVNAGGIINIAEELSTTGYSRDRAQANVDRIHDTTSWVMDLAADRGITTLEAAMVLVRRQLEGAPAAATR